MGVARSGLWAPAVTYSEPPWQAFEGKGVNKVARTHAQAFEGYISVASRWVTSPPFTSLRFAGKS